MLATYSYVFVSFVLWLVNMSYFLCERAMCLTRVINQSIRLIEFQNICLRKKRGDTLKDTAVRKTKDIVILPSL